MNAIREMRWWILWILYAPLYLDSCDGCQHSSCSACVTVTMLELENCLNLMHDLHSASRNEIERAPCFVWLTFYFLL